MTFRASRHHKKSGGAQSFATLLDCAIMGFFPESERLSRESPGPSLCHVALVLYKLLHPSNEASRQQPHPSAMPPKCMKKAAHINGLCQAPLADAPEPGHLVPICGHQQVLCHCTVQPTILQLLQQQHTPVSMSMSAATVRCNGGPSLWPAVQAAGIDLL